MTEEFKNLLLNLLKDEGNDDIKQIDFKKLLSLLEQMGLSKNDIIPIFEQFILNFPPKNDQDRVLQFHRLIEILKLDLPASKEEENRLRNLGLKMGVNPMAVEEILQLMLHNENNIPQKKIMEIFRRFHN